MSLSLLSLLCVAPALAELDPVLTYEHLNADLENDISGPGWGKTPLVSWFQDATYAHEGTGCARIDLTAGTGTQSLWNIIGFAAPVPDIRFPNSDQQWGERLQYGVWFRVKELVGTGTVTIQVDCVDTTPSTPTQTMIARRVVALEDLPVDEEGGAQNQYGGWVYLSADPQPNGRTVADHEQVRVDVVVTGQGEFYVDTLESGRFEYGQYHLSNGSFDDPTTLTGWTALGDVSNPPSSGDFFANDAYYGDRYVVMGDSVTPRLLQSMTIASGPGSPKHGKNVEAGVWLRFLGDVTPNAGGVELVVQARGAAGPFFDIAQQTYVPTTSDVTSGCWIYVETQPLVPVPYRIGGRVVDRLRVRVKDNVSGTVWADFVQVGEQHSVNGNPDKLSIVGWNPRARARIATDPPASSATNEFVWRLWHTGGSPSVGMSPPACASFLPVDEYWKHNPENLRSNGRRDAAVSTEHGNVLPLIGAYSGSDPEVTMWQLEMAAAAGIDVFRVESTGHQFALQRWDATSCVDPTDPPTPLNNWNNCDPNHYMAPNDAVGMAVLFDIAESTGVKVIPATTAFDYFFGFCPIANHYGWLCLPDQAAQEQAIIDDLDALIDFYWSRKCTFKVDGAMVVIAQGSHAPFAPEPPPSEEVRLGERWAAILANLESQRAAEGKPYRPVVINGTRTNTNAFYNWVANEDPLTQDPNAGQFWGGGQRMLYIWEPITSTSRLHKYKNLDDFFPPSSPLANPLGTISNDPWEDEAVEQMKVLVDGILQWEAGDDANRIPIGYVYPDFDNSGKLGTLASYTPAPPADPFYTPVCVQIISEHALALGDGWLDRTYRNARDHGFDWFYINTWNDWPEFTQIEPVWHPDYDTVNETQAVRDQVFGNLIEVQRLMNDLKGSAVPIDVSKFDVITKDYLATRSTVYD